MSIWVHKKIFQCFTICKFKISQAKEHTKEKVMGLNYTYNITYGYIRTASTMKHQSIGCKYDYNNLNLDFINDAQHV
jgi:hypothetical protein